MVKVPCAKDISANKLVFALHATRKRKYNCFECSGPVVVHRGKKRAAHFAHLSLTRHCNGGGESAVHRSTKEWVKKIAVDPDFAVWCTCSTCSVRFVVFTGSAANSAIVECRALRFVVDVAVFCKGRIAAFLEILHTHKTSEEKRKMLEATAGWPCPVLEIKAVNLVEEAYPKQFECVSPRRCNACVKKATERHRKAMHERYARFFRQGLDRIKARRHLIAERIARWWLFRTRVRRVGKRLKELFAPCTVCRNPVERADAACVMHACTRRLQESNVSTDCLRLKDGEIMCSVKCLQTRCAERCLGCLEPTKSGRWCACKKRTMAKCLVCKRWGNKERMGSILPVPGLCEFVGWACLEGGECGKTCTNCSALYPYNAKYPYSTQCFRCNYKRKRGKIWSPTGDGHGDGACAECGVYISTVQYNSTCYSCNRF